MATKDKKIPPGKRPQTASPTPPPMPDVNETAENSSKPLTVRAKPDGSLLVRKFTKAQMKRNQQKKLAIKMKAKTNRRAVTQKLSKSLLAASTRVFDAKKLLKNGKLRRRPSPVKQSVPIDSGPPVLEPIFPIEDNLDKKPMDRKRFVRNPVFVKMEIEDAAANSDSSANSVKSTRRSRLLNMKLEQKDSITETIEGVISDFTIRADEIKKELDSLSESSKSDSTKPKKLTKKQKLCLLKKEIKKENIENAVTTIGPNDQKVIDMLDLNVMKLKKPYPKRKRRYTFEQYPMGGDFPTADFPAYNVFKSLPSVNVAKPKRKVINPYSIRPHPRLLRNGKQRKLKETLLTGLDDTRKPKKYSSNLNDANKLSEYESDSSFSDTTACPKETDLKGDQITDTNSNLYQLNDHDDSIYANPSEKVPEKLLILDIMKQTFNEKAPAEQTENVTGAREDMNEIISKIVETMGTKEFTATIESGPAPVVVENGVSDVPDEDVATKESILNALGLRSLRAAEEAKTKEKSKSDPPSTAAASSYTTGTLKTVIKLNRETKRKKGHNQPLKMTLQKSRTKAEGSVTHPETDYKIMKEGGKQGGQSSDTAGAHRKSHYCNRSNPDASSEHTSDGETANSDAPAKALVIPEKASSFSIHPDRQCKDECTYCFGKFGLFDTPCHIAQIKSVDRQDKILSTEKHLMRDSCLCDACYRHIDRKANTPSYAGKSFKRGPMIAPGPKENHCHVLACTNVATNVLRRKWIIKMKKQICQVINIDLDNPGLHSIPICDDHYVALEHLMVCAMCKRRLARNHIHYIGPEVEELNEALQGEEIPLKLADKPVVCKLCKCFATIILKSRDERPDNCSDFFTEYKKRLLHFNNIVPMDEADAEEPIVVPTKEKLEKEQPKKKRKVNKSQAQESAGSPPPVGSSSVASESKSEASNEQNCNAASRPESPSEYMVDYNSLIPSIAMDCEDEPPKTSTNEPKIDQAVQRLGSNPCLSVRQLFPGEEDLGLRGHIDFGNVTEKTPEGWEKCTMTIQYDPETRQLWNELLKPYGNQSSFLRHLILLEKYFRSGDLELKVNASHQSINYSESVKNRLRAYDNIPTGTTRNLNFINYSESFINAQRSSMNAIDTRSSQLVKTAMEESRTRIATTSNHNTQQPPNVSITSVRPQKAIVLNQAVPASKPQPPGLISLLPGTNRPAPPGLIKTQTQKIKFPITKNWRPTLIPIDQTGRQLFEKKPGLVQVISGGKPFHITLEDYKKMCAIKRSFEMKMQRKASSTTPAHALKITQTSAPNGGKKLKETENILEKLDKQVENLESKFNNEKKVFMPKIPKSLTVIPQTVSRNVTPKSNAPVLLVTQKKRLSS